MRVVFAPDKFAGTLSAVEAAAAMARGWARRSPDDELVQVPMSDGGPGFVDVLHQALGGELHAVTVAGPYGEPTPAAVLRCDDTAYVESAQAVGLHLTPPERRDPERAHTRGLGELLAAALDDGSLAGSSSGSAARPRTTPAPACSRPWARPRRAATSTTDRRDWPTSRPWTSRRSGSASTVSSS